MTSANFIINESMVRGLQNYLNNWMIDVTLDPQSTVAELHDQLEALFLRLFDERCADSPNIAKCPLNDLISRRLYAMRDVLEEREAEERAAAFGRFDREMRKVISHEVTRAVKDALK